MEQQREQNFRFWVPLDKLEKSGKGENKKLKIGGIASTKRRDMDGESLDPSGFDLSYFKNKGIVNWNHNKSPDAIIGEPTSATITDEGLYVEAELYGDNPLAKSVYSLAETLQKSSKTRRLGFSIEGKATKRDENDPTNVSKALITNIALTISPKNPDSIVDIIKGEFTALAEEELKPYDYGFDSTFEVEKLEKIQKAVEPTDDLSGKEGNIEKGMEAGHTSGTDNLNQPNSGASLKTESVEGNEKNQIDEESDEDKKKTVKFTKSQAIDELMKNNSVITLEKAIQIVETLNILEMAKDENTANISAETIEKALTVLGIGKEQEVDDLNKGAADNLNKGDEGGDNSNSVVEDDEDDDSDEDNKKVVNKMKKSLDLMASENIEMFKGVGTLLKGIYDQNKSVIEELNEVRSENADLRKSLDEIGSMPAGQRKSITTSKPVERNFEKGIVEEEEQSGNVLSVSMNKGIVLDLLDKMAFEKGFNQDIANAMTAFESSGVIEKGIIDLIKKEKQITLVK